VATRGIVTIEVRHNPVPDGGFVLIYADITERKRSEAEIRAAPDASGNPPAWRGTAPHRAP
jgi:hypothetical protein